jgi:ABC-type nitrate/sulfonate/bicarbonate transport system substrate-binding protein
MLADSGYNPYRIIFGTKAFVDAHPEAVRRFIAASLRGWDEFMTGDSEAAKASIAKRNDNMPALIEYSIQAMKDQHIIYGKAGGRGAPGAHDEAADARAGPGFGRPEADSAIDPAGEFCQVRFAAGRTTTGSEIAEPMSFKDMVLAIF